VLFPIVSLRLQTFVSKTHYGINKQNRSRMDAPGARTTGAKVFD
jgi:hypothetical protein